MLPTHLNCIPLVSKFDSIFVNRDTVPWLCVRCSETTFPFNHTRDDGEFFSNLSESWGALRGIPYCISNLMEQSRFLLDMNESVHSPLFDIDPDLHALNGQYMTNALTSSSYYLSHTFKSKLQNNNVVRESFSVIHLNIRSANANLKYFKPYLDVLDHDWTCIGLTETWFKDDTFSQFSIPGTVSVVRPRNLIQTRQFHPTCNEIVSIWHADEPCKTARVVYDQSRAGNEATCPPRWLTYI